jgi:hypothetical protein
MTGQDSAGYRPGRGLPPYLLSRNYADSSTDSDGASRTFASSSYSMASDKDSDCTSVAPIPRPFSYMSTSSSITWSDTTSISTGPSTFQYDTSSMSQSIGDETRTLRNETCSREMESPSSYISTGPTYEASNASMEKTVSSNFSAGYLYAGPVYLTNTYDFNTNMSSTWDMNAPAVHRSEDMFPPYVSVISNVVNEQHRPIAKSSSLY